MATEQKRQKFDTTVLRNLPKEVWCIIFSYLPKDSRKNATSTCRFWFEIIRGDSRFSGNISISWIELQNSSFDWDNWPSLKTINITDTSFPSPKLALEAMKDIDFKKCQSLEKVTFGVEFDVAELSRVIITTTTKNIETKTTTAISGEDTTTETEKISTSRKYVRKFMKELGTVLALVFNPKSDIDLFKLEHLDKLKVHMKFHDIERALKVMKMIGEAAINLRWLIVGGNSFDHPEFFGTGFKNFGMSLKIFTLEDDCFRDQFECEVDYIDSVHTFFKTLNKSCPNLTCLNLGSVFELGGCQSNGNSEFEKFSMAGFETVKDLNIDFTFHSDDEGGHGCFNWFFGLINDCNNIETLNLNGLNYPYFGNCSEGEDMDSIKHKFKNLKKCQIRFHKEIERNLYLEGWSSCKEYAYALAKDLDETFADRKTELKVLIRAHEYQDGYIDEEKGFQIIKMSFENSVISILDS